MNGRTLPPVRETLQAALYPARVAVRADSIACNRRCALGPHTFVVGNEAQLKLGDSIGAIGKNTVIDHDGLVVQSDARPWVLYPGTPRMVKGGRSRGSGDPIALELEKQLLNDADGSSRAAEIERD